MKIEQRLKELNIELPPAWQVPANLNFVRAVQSGNMLYVSGHGPTSGVGLSSMYKGKLGREYSVEEGSQAARLTMLNILATMNDVLGDLDRVVKIVKVLGLVASAEGFNQQPAVINGGSDLLVQVFGEAIGKHARSAIGVAELPIGIPVEIEMVVEIR